MFATSAARVAPRIVSTKWHNKTRRKKFDAPREAESLHKFNSLLHNRRDENKFTWTFGKIEEEKNSSLIT